MKLIILILISLITNLSQQDSSKQIDSSIILEPIQTNLDSILPLFSESKKETPKLNYPEYQNNAFRVGEELTFKVRYGFIRAGTAHMMVRSESLINDMPVYHIQTTAQSAASFSWIYKVDDVVNSYIDKTGLFSWKFEKKLREGRYKADLSVNYIPEDSIAAVNYIRYDSDMEINKKEKYKIKTPPFSLDILAAFYYIRTQPLEAGKSIFITNHDNKKVYDLEVKVHKKEIIEVEAGTFRCLLVEPLLKGEGIFKQKGRLKVWLTDDEYKFPVQMTSEILVGHITTELEKIKGIPEPIPSRVINE